MTKSNFLSSKAGEKKRGNQLREKSETTNSFCFSLTWLINHHSNKKTQKFPSHLGSNFSCLSTCAHDDTIWSTFDVVRQEQGRQTFFWWLLFLDTQNRLFVWKCERFGEWFPLGGLSSTYNQHGHRSPIWWCSFIGQLSDVKHFKLQAIHATHRTLGFQSRKIWPKWRHRCCWQFFIDDQNHEISSSRRKAERKCEYLCVVYDLSHNSVLIWNTFIVHELGVPGKINTTKTQNLSRKINIIEKNKIASKNEEKKHFHCLKSRFHFSLENVFQEYT